MESIEPSRRRRVVSLCSGVGLIDLGLEWAGYRTVQFCEINPFGQMILNERFPGVPIHGDVRTIQPKECDVVAAGFPCQPFSVAGKGLGADDPRHLWPAINRAIRIARPRYVILENVPGLLARGLGDVLGDLADAGFDAEWTVFSAADVGAPHLRRRVWIVATSDADSVRVWDEHGGFFREGWGSDALAYASRAGLEGCHVTRSQFDDASRRGDQVADTAREREREPADEAHTIAGGRDPWPEPRGGSERADVLDADSGAVQSRRQRRGARGAGSAGWWAVEPDVCRMAHGVPSRMDRLAALGNGVVPQCAELVGLRLRMLAEGGALMPDRKRERKVA